MNHCPTAALMVLCLAHPTWSAGQPPSRALPPLRAVDLACLPRIGVISESPLPRVVGSQRGSGGLYSPGDTVILDNSEGVAVGGEYFVRRLVPAYAMGQGSGISILHTAGWVRVLAVEGTAAVATVVDACDGILKNDFLQPADWPEPPTPGPAGQADYSDGGTILFSEEGRVVAGPGDFLVINRGSDNGVQPGQRLTLYRDSADAGGPVTELGEAFLVEVTPEWSVAQILTARDFIYSGTGVAPQK